MPVTGEFARAMGRKLLLNAADPWQGAWTLWLCTIAAGAIRSGMPVGELGTVLTGLSAASWSIQAYVAPAPQATPPVAEVTPYAFIGPLSWTNTNSDRLPVTFRTVAVTAINSVKGISEPIIWEPLVPEVTLVYGDVFRLESFKFRLTEVLDG